MPESRLRIPNRIKDIRTAKGMTQQGFANMAKIRGGRSSVSNLERQSRAVEARTIYNVSRALEKPPTEIFLFDEMEYK